MQISRYAFKFALDPLRRNNSLNFIDRGCTRIPNRSRVIVAKIAYKLLELNIGNVSKVCSCMAGVD